MAKNSKGNFKQSEIIPERILTFKEIIDRLHNVPLPPRAVIPLSYTRINTLLSCPYKFLMQYCTKIDKVTKRRLKSDANIAGTIVHNVFETYLAYLAASENKNPKDFDLCWVDAKKMYELKEGAITTTAEELLETFREGTERCVQKAENLIIKNNLRPLNEFKFTVGNSFNFTKQTSYPMNDPFFFYGAADLLLFNDDHSQALVIDWKTYSRSKDKIEDESNNLQLDMYKYFMYKWFNILYGTKSVDVAIAYVPDSEIVRLHAPINKDNEQQLSERTRLELTKYTLAAEKFAEDFRTKSVKKTPYKGCRWCDFNLLCKKGHDFGLRYEFKKEGFTI